jgi:predicted dehydrogenase
MVEGEPFMNMNRRDFLQDSALFAAALAVLGPERRPLRAADDQAGSANETLNVAVVGVRGRGRDHVAGFAGKHNCVVTTICDADEAVIGPAMTAAEKAQKRAPRFEQDIRKVIEDKSIHIVSIATPNHWHALAAIWALQAGKDVYVEKPVSHNVSEGRRLVEAARKYHRICQSGTQSRSNSGMREAMAFLHAGKLGKIKLARGLCYKPRGSIGKVDGPQPIPKTIDYDLWCGPAPVKPLLRQKLHYDWHWIWDYGNGDLGNQGIHEMDKARWGLGKNELARAVISVGGRFGYVDDGETANTQICIFDYGDSELVFEVRGLSTPDLLGAKIGNIFYGTEGYLVCPSYTGGVAYTPKGEVIAKFTGGGDHYANFVEAVRARKPEILKADVLEGHLSSALCHLGNISLRAGSQVPFGEVARGLTDSKDAGDSFHRMVEHLKNNKVAVDDTRCWLGKKLIIDPQTETFLNDKSANVHLSREYRKGFEVPARI